MTDEETAALVQDGRYFRALCGAPFNGPVGELFMGLIQAQGKLKDPQNLDEVRGMVKHAIGQIDGLTLKVQE